MAVRERVQPEAGKVVDMSWDPITRIVGNLGIYTKIDFDSQEVLSCKSTSSLFRGYSVFMKGKDPRDAHFITSRICGICGDNHAVCSKAETTAAPGMDVHGYRTIGEIMTSYNPFVGETYKEALHMSRIGREMI